MAKKRKITLGAIPKIVSNLEFKSRNQKVFFGLFENFERFFDFISVSNDFLPGILGLFGTFSDMKRLFGT